MSVEAVEKTKAVFGEIALASLQDDAELAKLVMGIVRDACKRRARGGEDVESVANNMLSGRYKLWGVMSLPSTLQAVAVTHQQGDVLEIKIAGPTFDDIAPFIPVLMKKAKAQGCARMVLSGPPFFRFQLPKGWFQREVRYECELDGAGQA